MRRDWETLNATERAREVGELYFRGLPVMSIAKELGAKVSEVKHHIDIIQISAYKSDRMELFFENLQQRTMEHLMALDAQLAIAYSELDKARERVAVVSGFGEPLYELDPKTGERTNRILTQPRNAPAIVPLLRALESIMKQKADVLRIVGNKTDVNVKIQVSHQIQTVILEFIQTLSPDIYAELYRQIQAIVPNEMMTIDANPRALAA